MRYVWIIIVFMISINANSQFATKQFFVKEDYAACGINNEKKCLQIKENLQEDWRIFREEIVGFKFKKGYLFVIEVNTNIQTNNLTGEKVVSYSLKRILEKRKVKKVKVSKAKKVKENKSTTKNSNSNSTVKKEEVHVQLFGKQWKLVRIEMNGKFRETPSTKAFVEFDVVNNRISGNAGCNSFFGSAEYKDSAIKVTNISTTRMACKNEMELEKTFLEKLNLVDRYEFVNGNLNLLKGNQILLVFN